MLPGRVLICDDNADSALIWRPQAALVDIGMPDMDGYAVGRAIRASPGGDSMC